MAGLVALILLTGGSAPKPLDLRGNRAQAPADSLLWQTLAVPAPAAGSTCSTWASIPLVHRLHNKVMVVDNRAALMGGRKPADAAFPARHA